MNYSGFSQPPRWARRLLMATLVFFILAIALLGLAWPCAALVSTLQLRELPSSQVIWQSTQTVSDHRGQPWRLTFYKAPQAPQDPPSLILGIEQPDRQSALNPQTALLITSAAGSLYRAPALPQRSSLDRSATAFDGQYRLDGLGPSLRADSAAAVAAPAVLTITLQNGQAISLELGPELLQEWDAVASCQALLCQL